MKNKRIVSVLFALSLVMIADIQSDKSYDATTVQMVNTDLMVLTMSSLQQVNEQVQQATHNSNCDK